MRIALVSYSLLAGGAERVLANIANYWAQAGWEVDLITLDDSEPFYRLHPRVHLQRLAVARQYHGFANRIMNYLRRVRALRRTLRELKPQAVISFLSTVNISTLLATRGLGVPVIVSERVDPLASRLPHFWQRWIRDLVYRCADSIVMQSRRAVQAMPRPLQSRCRIICNPVTVLPNSQSDDGQAQLPQPAIVAMGRLERQKGHDLLITAFGRMKQHAGWKLVILGEGSERPAREQQIESHGLGDRVILMGRVTNPGAYLRKADVFVLPSRYEGFPNALCEAMALSLPVVAADCRSGPAEIIRDGVDGLLVPPEDPDALMAALDRLISNPSLRTQLASAASAITQRFGVESIMAQWEALLAELTPAKQDVRLVPDSSEALRPAA